MTGKRVGVLMLRSHYPDARTEKIRSVLKESMEVRLHSWCRYRDTGPVDDDTSLFHIPLGRQSPLVLPLLPFFQISILYHILRSRPSVIHTVDFDTVLPAIIMGKVMGIPVVYEIYDYYADMVSDDRFGKRAGSLLKRIDDFVISHVDEVIVVDENRMDQMGYHGDNVTTIYNSPDIQKRWSPPDFPTGVLRVFFGGFVSRERGIRGLCEAVTTIPVVHLEICGEAETEFADELRREFGDQENIELHLEYTDHDEILRRTATSHLVPILYDSTVSNNRYSSPNKYFEAMAMGVPVIAYRGCSVDEKVREDDSGIVVDEGDVEQIRSSLLQLSVDEDAWRRMSVSSRTAYCEKYSWTMMRDRLIRLYGRIPLK